MNIQKVMNSSALHRAFVAQAVGEYADKIIQNQEQVKKDLEHSLINPDDWISIAKEFDEELKK